MPQQYSDSGVPLNGYSHHTSPDSSIDQETGTLISRTQKQQTTQQITTTTKTIREIQYFGSDGQPLNGVHHSRLNSSPGSNYESLSAGYPGEHCFPSNVYETQYSNGRSPYSQYYDECDYSDYPVRQTITPPSLGDQSPSPQTLRPDYLRRSNHSGGSGYPPISGYDELDTTLMPPSQMLITQDGFIPGSYNPNDSVFNEEEYPPTAYFDDELDEPISSLHQTQMTPTSHHPSLRGGSIHWRDPDLHEVIEFLNNPNSVIKANAAAYLQHLCYMDDPVKTKTRQLGGIPPLVALLANEIPEIHRNACGALRNLSYGRQNDENKRAIKNANGIANLVRLLRKTPDNEIKELVTGVLWNLSSCDDLKRAIIDEALSVLVNVVLIPHSGWEQRTSNGQTSWSTVLRNSSGILRNISSAGDYGRKKLRETEGLVDSVVYLVRSAIEKANIDNKSVENSVCVLRNLSYRSQEVEDPNYDKRQFVVLASSCESRGGVKPSPISDNLGCFGASKNKRKDSSFMGSTTPLNTTCRQRSGPIKGMELLWQPEIVQPYLNLLSNCSNPETLEAAAGAVQNLSACYWQPSIDIRAAVRKEKGLPILVELLRMEVDRVVCAVATALRNLAIDQRNKELIGKYAMRDLIQKLPGGNAVHDHGTSNDTIAAVLATLNEVIKKHPEFSRSLLEAGGVSRLMNISRTRSRYNSRVVKFASQVLYSMWIHQELRDVYRKAGWKEQDFVSKTVAARNARPNSPSNLNSTLNRPMASQSGTRYEDRTIQRTSSASLPRSLPCNNNNSSHYNSEEVPLENLSLYEGQAQMYPSSSSGTHPSLFPGEPVYAQVNRDRKKNSRLDSVSPSEYANHWQMTGGSTHGLLLDQSNHSSVILNSGQNSQLTAGDSWV